jgi:Mrp family chromosome partitioning ATPase
MADGKSCGDSGCTKESCEGCSKNPGSFLEKTHELNSIGKVIGVVSGKGGVGKSLVTAMLSVLMSRKGYQTGIFDADITGSSIPKMFGINKKAESDALGIYPQITHNNIKVMSINLLLEKPEQPVIWRGPILAGAVKQFWTDVIWGNLDFMFIDMPPGTGDVPLTVFQSIPLDGIIIVTTPQELVSMIVKKAYNMAKQMNIPVLGIVENMSYVKCPDCGKEINIFGESKLDAIANELKIEVLGRMPIDSNLANLADSGQFERVYCNYLDDAVSVIENKFKAEK